MYKFLKSKEISLALYKKWRENKRCQHFSIIFKNNKILAIGQNSAKTHPLNILNLPPRKHNKRKILHIKGTCSELDAFIILKNKINLTKKNNLTLVNLRINNNGEFSSSRPCNFCHNLIKYINFKEVWFTNNNGEFERYLK